MIIINSAITKNPIPENITTNRRLGGGQKNRHSRAIDANNKEHNAEIGIALSRNSFIFGLNLGYLI